MPIVTFWSNSEKTIGQTVTASVVATTMAMEHNYKILLISADMQNDSMEWCFGAQQSNKNLLKSIVPTPQINIDNGINGLIKMAKSNRITPEIIKDYTKIIYKNRLEVLYSTSNSEFTIEEQMEYFKNIILNASKYYDYVIVDLRKGLKQLNTLNILEISDVVVLNTEQGTKTLESFLKILELKNIINTHKFIWNICKYNPMSKYNIKNLTRTIWKRKQIYSLTYNTLIFEASTEGNLPETLLRLTTVKNDEESKKILEEANQIIQGIQLKQRELQMRMG